MKKIFLTFLSFTIIFSSCKKNSTDNDTIKDEITVQIYVEKAGAPLFNAYCEVTCTINEPVSDTYNLGNTRPNPISDTNTIQTGNDGVASIKYVNRKLIGQDVILLTAVEVRHATYGVMKTVEDLEISIATNTSYTYNVILE
ncbi:hypothetical protein ACFL4T_00775 [candidate division KSB1 bacterium]